MDDRDEWLEGVRRWYFGGEAPPGESPDELAWPASVPATHGSACAQLAVSIASRAPAAAVLQDAAAR